MNSTHFFPGRLLFGLLVIVLGACGGGGSGDDDGVVLDTSQPLALTDSNAPAVTGLVVEAAMGGVTASSLGSIVIASVATPGPVGGVEFDVLRVTHEVLDRVWTMRLQGTFTIAAVRPAQLPPSVGCSGGGTVSAVWTDADLSGELSVGDGVALTFNTCIEGDLTLTGDATVGFQSLIGDPATDPAWTVGFRLNFDNLTGSGSDVSVLVLGSLDVTVDTQASGTVITDATTEITTGPGMTASSFLYFGEGEDFTELTLYTVSFQENADGSFILSSQGTVESSFTGGTVSFETTQDITGTGFDIDAPSFGRVLILGAANSSILLRILDSVLVELDIDDEGNGFDPGDSTITSSWDALSAAADAL